MKVKVKMKEERKREGKGAEELKKEELQAFKKEEEDEVGLTGKGKKKMNDSSMYLDLHYRSVG